MGSKSVDSGASSLRSDQRLGIRGVANMFFSVETTRRIGVVRDGMEWLWHVSEHDEVLGRVERSEAHRSAVRHRAGVVLLRSRDGRVFLTQRAASKQIFPNTYDTSASFHVSHGESYEAAAQREALEELGLLNFRCVTSASLFTTIHPSISLLPCS
jgi:hypothetical protein